MSEKVSTFARSVMKLARYAHSSLRSQWLTVWRNRRDTRDSRYRPSWHLARHLIIASFVSFHVLRRNWRRKKKGRKCRKESLLMALSFYHLDDWSVDIVITVQQQYNADWDCALFQSPPVREARRFRSSRDKAMIELGRTFKTAHAILLSTWYLASVAKLATELAREVQFASPGPHQRC